MEKSDILNASIEGKKEFKLPKGATIISKQANTRIEEIENGFLIRKTYDIKYKTGEETSYEYYSKTWYVKDNPVTIKLPKETNSLADKLD